MRKKVIMYFFVIITGLISVFLSVFFNVSLLSAFPFSAIRNNIDIIYFIWVSFGVTLIITVISTIVELIKHYSKKESSKNSNIIFIILVVIGVVFSAVFVSINSNTVFYETETIEETYKNYIPFFEYADKENSTTLIRDYNVNSFNTVYRNVHEEYYLTKFNKEISCIIDTVNTPSEFIKKKFLSENRLLYGKYKKTLYNRIAINYKIDETSITCEIVEKNRVFIIVFTGDLIENGQITKEDALKAAVKICNYINKN